MNGLGCQGVTDKQRSRLARRRRMATAVVAMLFVVMGTFAASAVAAKPSWTLPPEIVGEERIGAEDVCGSGSWTESPSFEYEFVREGIPISARAPYPGNVHFYSKADVGHQIWCIVTASNGEGSTTAETWNAIGPPQEGPTGKPPENLTKPEITGTPAVGKVLTCSTGTWTENPTSYTYQWLRNKEGVGGATASTHTVVSEDEGKSLSCQVTAGNASGKAAAESTGMLVQPTGVAPKNTEAPKVLGTPAVNEVLTCYEGTWEGSAPLIYRFQWVRDGTKIAMATGSTYSVEAGDEGHRLSCSVTAENKIGKLEAASTEVSISTRPPQVVEPPAISGTPGLGLTLICSTGTWTGAGTPFKYEAQWLRDGSPISGATSGKYTVVAADVGHSLICAVTATNTAKQSATSLSASKVVPEKGGEGKPVNTGKPGISGSAAAGHELTCSQGTWTENPTHFTYQWWRDPKKTGAKPLELGTTSVYKVVPEDEGHTLSCKVTAINAEGSAEAESEAIKVAGSPPINEFAPEVAEASGTPQVGESLTCVRGSWRGAPPPEYTYRWLRDKSTVIGVTNVYTLTTADRGHAVSCVVKAKNIEGEAEAESSNGVYIGGSPPVDIIAPAIAGTPTENAALTCGEGTWSGTPTPAFSVQWLLNNVPIPSATGSTYVVRSSDRGLNLTCLVTAKNIEGTATASSAVVHVPGIRPTPVEDPKVAGGSGVGQTLTCEPGIWEGKPPPVFSYQWLRDQTPISGATGKTYLVERGDVGHLITCNVTARNSEGTAEVGSKNSAVITVPGSGGNTGNTGGGGSQSVLSYQQMLDAVSKQLVRALGNLRLVPVLKGGGNAFAFVAPAVGTLEVVWYVYVQGAHKKTTKLVLAEGKTYFSKALSKATVRVRLTAKGRAALAHRKQFKVTARGVFAVANSGPVTWLAPILLKH